MIKFRTCRGRLTGAYFGFQIMIGKYTVQLVRGACGVFDNTSHTWIIESKIINRLFK